MSRLSLWKDGKHTNDYKFFDRRISEMFTIGGTGILLHKYLGPQNGGPQLVTNTAQTAPGTVLNFANTSTVNLKDSVTGIGIPANATVVAKTANTVTLSVSTTQAVGLGVSIGFSTDASQPSYINQSEQNIQDLLWQENRDRKYDDSVYTMRGIYQKQDQDFDLSQFGLFLQTGTIFMTFHLRDMVDMIGRKIMSGDVLELQHLTDFDALNQDVPAALKRFYSVSDASWPSEGFSPTWWPHLWRVRLNPLVDSQEYSQIFQSIVAGTAGTTTQQLLSTLDTNLAINDAVIAKAKQNVPKSGYDTSSLYDQPTNPNGSLVNVRNVTSDNTTHTADDTIDTADEGMPSPRVPIPAYLGGDSVAPNGLPLGAGISFPLHPNTGDFFMRTDYLPNRVFRFSGSAWIVFNDVQRTSLTQGAGNNTLLGSFVNDTNTFVTKSNVTVPEKQSLSNALTPRADNL
jgi:hypothetical protein